MSSLLIKATGGIGCTIVALPLLAALTLAAALGGNLPSNGAAARPSERALADIPPAMLALYQQAAPECPGLPWTVLAAIGKVETDHARNPRMVSTAGAVGPMQFLPSTFTAYAYPVPPGGRNPPTPWDPVDAVYAAARLLCANGAQGGRNLRSAIRAYNHDDQYVNHVLTLAARYSRTPPTTAATCPALPPAAEPDTDRLANQAALTAVRYACSQLGAPYVWGGTGERGFDCSGLVQAAYLAAGITLPRVAQQQYDHGPHIPDASPLLPGDLLFYGASPSSITHVAIYTAGGQAIDAPHPGAVVHQSPARTDTPLFQGATRPAASPRGAR